jgi:hypothetical protein
MGDAREGGMKVEGALLWFFTTRGGLQRLQEEDNAWTLIIPRGPGQPLQVLSGLEALCREFDSDVLAREHAISSHVRQFSISSQKAGIPARFWRSCDHDRAWIWFSPISQHQ